MDFDDNGYSTCSYCKGNKIIEVFNPKIYTVCPECRGTGGTDWVSHAMGRKPPPNYTDYRITQENILKLIEAIKREGRKIGHEITVTTQCQTLRYEPPYAPEIIFNRTEVDECIKLKVLKNRRDKCTE